MVTLDCSLQSHHHGDSPGKNAEWAAISFSRLHIIKKETQTDYLFYRYYLLIVKFTPHQLIFLLVQIQNPFHLCCFEGLSPQLNREGFRSWSCQGLRRQIPSVCHSLAAAQLAQPVGGMSCWQILPAILGLFLSFWSLVFPSGDHPGYLELSSPGFGLQDECCNICHTTLLLHVRSLKGTCFPNGGLSHWLL